MNAREKLEEATAAISMAAMMLNSVAPTLEQFVRTSRTVEPEDAESRATMALLRPLAESALSFAQTYKAQLRAAASALEEVNAHG
ncbi:MAG: hypothetical protein LCH86_21000 [Proteobacteria bacterium]|nr:hypothetical protein [Pseudomonadota bacterium]